MTKSKSVAFVFVSSGITFAFLAAILILNMLVDPLWFFGGDKLMGRNFAFDERTARAARFTSTPGDYDCYIFGASRVGLMNEHRFSGYNCFTFSFAAATPRELVAFANFARKFGKHPPRLVVVGIDDFDFIDQADTFTVPISVTEMERPRFWDFYFSARVATWSIETLLDRSPLERYYGSDLTGQVRSDARTFQALHLALPPGQHWHFTDQNVPVYANFRKIFPGARLIAYATPVAAGRIVQYQQDGILQNYLRALIDASRFFDEAYDFSIPSVVTADPSLTYDGSHFYPVVGDKIATALLAHESGFGVRIDGLTLEQLRALYKERIAKFEASHQQPVATALDRSSSSN